MWNFGHTCIKNRAINTDDIKNLSATESVKLVRCKARNWIDIGEELMSRKSITALEFDRCIEVGLFGGISPAGDDICTSVCKSQSLLSLKISTSEIH